MKYTTIESAVKSVNAHKGFFKKIRTLINNCAQAAETAKVAGVVPEYFAKELMDLQADLADRHDKMQRAYMWLSEHLTDETEIQANEAKADNICTDFVQSKKEIWAALDGYVAPAVRVVSGGGGGGGSHSGGHALPKNVRPVTDLRPKQLELDANPEEFCIWVDQLAAYVGASNIDTCPPETQYAFLRTSLGTELAVKLDRKISENANEPNEMKLWLDLMDQLFEETYPTFTRRWRCFKHVQQPGELFDTFYTNLNAKMKEAKLEDLSTDKLKALIIICSTSDPKLLEKFQELKDPTEEDVLKKARDYEDTIKKRDQIMNIDEHLKAMNLKTGKGAAPTGD